MWERHSQKVVGKEIVGGGKESGAVGEKWPEESLYKEGLELFRITSGMRLIGVIEQ